MIPGTMPEIIADLYKRLADLERRFENRERTGTIAEVDAKKGLARVKLGEDIDGKPYLSAWIPWKEPGMGRIKFHIPPAVGEQVKVVSENGDLTDAMIDTSLPSTANPRPHDKEGEMKIVVDDKTYILVTGGKLEMRADHIQMKASRIDHDQG